MKKCFFNLFVFVMIFHNLGFAESLVKKTEIDLSQFERKVFSQNGEDGVLEKIFDIIGTQSKYYIEFGVEDGLECNTRYLRENHHFSGVMMDMKYENHSLQLYREVIDAENINDLFAFYKVPYEFDLLSIDIDSNDFYVWKAIQHQPRVVVIEYNPNHPPMADRVIVYDPSHVWDETTYYGATIVAMYQLGKIKGYSLIYADCNGVNLFFLRDDIVASIPYTFKNMNNPIQLYRRGIVHKPDPLNRQYVSSRTLLQSLR